MYAIFETGGKQYKVSVGDTVFVEKLVADEESEVVFDKVLCVGGDEFKVGAPYVDAKVTAKVAKQGKNLQLYLGHSLVNGLPQANLVVTEPEGITFEVPNPNTIVVKGINKQAVGQIAAVIRGKRPPEPYHGKGVKYSDEHVRRKAGKAGK